MSEWAHELVHLQDELERYKNAVRIMWALHNDMQIDGTERDIEIYKILQGLQ